MASDRAYRKPAPLHWKYRLRLAGVPLLARMARWLRIDWRALGRRLGREVLIAQARQGGPPGVVAPAERPLDVVFLTMMGGNQYNVSVDVVVGRALSARGHRVRYILCDQMLPACEVKSAGQEARWPYACAKCYAFGLRYLRAAGCDVVPVSRLIDEAAGGAQATAAPSLGAHVESALLKHYRVGVAAASGEVEQRRGLFAQAAAVSDAVGRRLARQRPDRVIMSHGIYCTWGPARDRLNEAGVPVVTYGKGKRRSTQKFNWTASSDWWDVAREWEAVADVPLTAEQASRLDAYLTSRRDHSADTLRYNFGDEETLAQTRRRLRLDGDKPTFVLFTNVLWDAASAQREVAFRDPIEWVMETIGWFARHPDRQLVVKIHPAEIVIGTKQPFASLIRRRFPRLPANVRVIEPHEKVNSWSIMQVADLGLVHTSTVGMELPLEGVPCAVVSRTHFRGKGFTVDVNGREEYFRLLEAWDPASVDRGRLRTLARRYAYLLFERYQLPWPFIYEAAHTDARALTVTAPADLLADATMRLLVGAIERREEFLLPACGPAAAERVPAGV